MTPDTTSIELYGQDSGIIEQSHVELVAAAIRGMSVAYGVSRNVPRYGAAVRGSTGKIFIGGQYKAETRQISLHAEQVALVHAAAHGESEISMIAIVSDEDPEGRSFTNPCGICKQALYESYLASRTPMLVIMANMQGEYRVKKLEELIVYPWPEE